MTSNKKFYYKPAVILVNPQLGENVGMAARAMLNFGLNELRLVSPRDGWPNQKAKQSSAGAFDILGKKNMILHWIMNQSGMLLCVPTLILIMYFQVLMKRTTNSHSVLIGI